MSFIHLHTHSEYSLLDGLGKVSEIVAKAKELNQPAIALTDHGAMHGTIKFYVEARNQGVKPIIGMEGYMARRSRHDKEAQHDKEPFHILLLAKNLTGYKNLMKLSTIGWLEGFYYKPRLDYETLRAHSEGLIATTGCVSAEIPDAIISNQPETAREKLETYIDIFGKENLFAELQRHQLNNRNGELYRILEKANQAVVDLAREYGLKLIATNDAHYVEPDDAEAQDILLAIQTKNEIDDPNRKLTMIDSPDFYLRSTQEMKELFHDYPEAIENAQLINELITDNYNIPMGKMIFPHYETPQDMNADEYLRHLTYKRAERKYPQITDEVKNRIEKELEIIASKGYSTYTLIMEDLASFCRENNILINTRGSAAGSVVQYILDIVTVDPIKYHLPFERFLNPERASPPDVDLDVEDTERDRLIQYTIEKYGQETVAQIVTFGTMESRAAVRDIGRVMGLPYSFCDKVAKLIPPPPQGFSPPLEGVIDEIVELRELYDTNEDARKLLDLAKRVQGVARHASTHAAGVVIADTDVTEYAPLMKDNKTGKIMTQYDMYSLDMNAVGEDAVGLLKMDYLGLRNLTILKRSIELVKKYHDIEIDPYNIPVEEEKVFEMFSMGDTTGVFQMESQGMRRVAQDLKPNRIEDIMALVALYRPGPMEMISQYVESKKDPQKVEYVHEDLKEVLEDTYGVLVYQEQCMEIANVMAGYSLGEGDLLRRAIGKKKKKLMAKEKKKFIQGAQEKGYTEAEAKEVFGYIEKFAAYGFNRSHSASYGMLAYQTAYMKALYPVEFYTALLSAESGDTDKVAMVINEIREKGVEVLAPNINQSGVDFTIEGRAIRFGLSAIKNVGTVAVKTIVKEREKHGRFEDLTDLCQRVNLHKANKKVFESLVKAGAMDSFGPRGAILQVLPEYLEMGQTHQKARAVGQEMLFGTSTNFEIEQELLPQRELPKTTEISERERLAWEKELLGFYLTKHPFEDELSRLEQVVGCRLGELNEEEHTGKEITLGGLVSNINTVLTRKDSREMAFVEIADLTGKIEAILFPDIYQNVARRVTEDSLVIMHGKLDNKDEQGLKLLVDKMLIPEQPHLHSLDSSAKIE